MWMFICFYFILFYFIIIYVGYVCIYGLNMPVWRAKMISQEHIDYLTMGEIVL